MLTKVLLVVFIPRMQRQHIIFLLSKLHVEPNLHTGLSVEIKLTYFFTVFEFCLTVFLKHIFHTKHTLRVSNLMFDVGIPPMKTLPQSR